MPRLLNHALLLISLLFVAAGIGMVTTGAEGGWPALLFFGICASIFVWQLWPRLLDGEPEPVEKLLQTYPGPLELRARRIKLAFLLIVGMAFAGVLAWLAWHEAADGLKGALLWIGAAFFGLSAPVLARQIATGRSIVLTQDSLKILHGGSPRLVRWSDTSEFHVRTIPPSYMPMIVFDDAASHGSPLARANAAVIGRNSALPDNYGLPHEDLARLLEGWRAKALATANRS